MNEPQNKDREETEQEKMARRARMPVRFLRLKDKNAGNDNSPVLGSEEVGKFWSPASQADKTPGASGDP